MEHCTPEIRIRRKEWIQMSEKLDRRITMAIDLKKNRLRIHRPTLRIMGSPPFVKLLFSRDHNAIAVVSCEEGDIPRMKEVRVVYDLRDNTHTFDIYSKELILVIQMAFKGLDRTSLYRLTGYSVSEENLGYHR